MAAKTPSGKSTVKGTRKPTAAAAKTSRSSKSRVISEQDIENKAHEIYLDRMAKGESGNHESDWHKAVEILNKKK
jgi:hypothetical protein